MISKPEVMDWLENIAKGIDKFHSDWHSDEELKGLASAALELLKPVKAIPLKRKKYIGRTGISYDGSCGNCHTYLMRGWKACPICGKEAKWE